MDSNMVEQKGATVRADVGEQMCLHCGDSHPAHRDRCPDCGLRLTRLPEDVLAALDERAGLLAERDAALDRVDRAQAAMIEEVNARILAEDKAYALAARVAELERMLTRCAVAMEFAESNGLPLHENDCLALAQSARAALAGGKH